MSFLSFGSFGLLTQGLFRAQKLCTATLQVFWSVLWVFCVFHVFGVFWVCGHKNYSKAKIGTRSHFKSFGSFVSFVSIESFGFVSLLGLLGLCLLCPFVSFVSLVSLVPNEFIVSFGYIVSLVSFVSFVSVSFEIGGLRVELRNLTNSEIAINFIEIAHTFFTKLHKVPQNFTGFQLVPCKHVKTYIFISLRNFKSTKIPLKIHVKFFKILL